MGILAAKLALHYAHTWRWAPSCGSRIHKSPPPGPAAVIMPSDIPNFILRGLRFATIVVSLLSSLSGLYADLIPENTYGEFHHRCPIGISAVCSLWYFFTRDAYAMSNTHIDCRSVIELNLIWLALLFSSVWFACSFRFCFFFLPLF